MSASPMARQAVATQAIPIKRVFLNDPSEMPSHYSQTPGGTMFSTTPGGTRIIYEKSFLLNLRNSPISRTPPHFDIPDNLVKGAGSPPKKQNHNNNHYHRKNNQNRKRNDSYNARRNSSQDDDHQFQLDL